MNRLPKRNDRGEFSVRNDITDLPRLNQAVHSFLVAWKPSSKTLFAVDLILEEVITNIVKYGYDDSLPHEILIRLEIEPDALRIAIEDDGHPFDPTGAAEPDTKQPLEERPVGGLGLYLVRDIAESIRYDRRGERNCLQLSLKREVER